MQSFIFRLKNEITFLGKKFYLSWQYKKDHIPVQIFGKTIFPEHLQKMSYFQVFFWERSCLIFRLKNKIIFSEKRNMIFPDNTRKIIFQCMFFGKKIFPEHLQKVLYFHIFFWERSSFIFRLKNKIKFAGKRNTIFPDTTRKIIFQCKFFWKTMFSKHFKKEVRFFVQWPKEI